MKFLDWAKYVSIKYVKQVRPNWLKILEPATKLGCNKKVKGQTTDYQKQLQNVHQKSKVHRIPKKKW